MALIYIKNRLSITNKRLLINMVFKVGSYEIFCNTFLLCSFCSRCRLQQFAHLIVVCQLNILSLKLNSF